MGRTLPTYRVMLEQYKKQWLRLFRNFPKQHQMSLQNMFLRAHNLADAASFWHLGQIPEKILFTILFSQYKSLLELQEASELPSKFF